MNQVELTTLISNFINNNTDLGKDGKYDVTDVSIFLKRLFEQLQKEKRVLMKFYVVQSHDGMFFRTRGFNAYMNESRHSTSWVNDISQAKIYTRPGPAKAQVTWWTKHHKKYAPYEVIECLVTDTMVHVPEKKKSKSKLERALDKPSGYFSM